MNGSALSKAQVFLARLAETAEYPGCNGSAESNGKVLNNIPAGQGGNSLLTVVSQLAQSAGLSLAGFETPESALGALIRPGQLVVIKPNWVFHENHSENVMDYLVTHAPVLRAILDLVMHAISGKIVPSDAPIQGCDLLEFMKVSATPKGLV